MIVDALLQLSDAQAFAATAFSTNTIDLGNPTVKNQIGSGEPMVLACQVDVAADHTTGDETYEFETVQSANANLSTPDIIGRIAIPGTTLVAGYKFAVDVSVGFPTKRFLGLQAVLGGTTPSITLTCFLMPRKFVDDWIPYAKGYSV